MRSSWLTPLHTIPSADHSPEPPNEQDRFQPNPGKVARETLRGAVTLGASSGGGVAVYRRALFHAAAGRLAQPWTAGVATVPALGVGASAMVDAATVQLWGKPTDPECRSMDGLQWISPAANGVALAAYRYAPVAKPSVGSVSDLLAHVVLNAAGGAVAYATREWLAQQAIANRRTPLPPRKGVRAEIPDRFLARAATQIGSTVLRLQALAQPREAGKLYLPVLLTSCVPYGWREDIARQIARLRKKEAMQKA